LDDVGSAFDETAVQYTVQSIDTTRHSRQMLHHQFLRFAVVPMTIRAKVSRMLDLRVK
jgi:hypothetical protein